VKVAAGAKAKLTPDFIAKLAANLLHRGGTNKCCPRKEWPRYG